MKRTALLTGIVIAISLEWSTPVHAQEKGQVITEKTGGDENLLAFICAFFYAHRFVGALSEESPNAPYYEQALDGFLALADRLNDTQIDKHLLIEEVRIEYLEYGRWDLNVDAANRSVFLKDCPAIAKKHPETSSLELQLE